MRSTACPVVVAAADAVGVGVNPQPGDVLLLTNDTAVHARFPLAPPTIPPPADRMLVRWNKLFWMAHPKDNARIADARRNGRRWIVEKRKMFDFDAVVELAEAFALKAEEAHGPGSLQAAREQQRLQKARNDCGAIRARGGCRGEQYAW